MDNKSLRILKTIFIITVLIINFFLCGSDHLFTSTDRLRDLSLAEDRVIPDMNEVVKLLQERIDFLKSISTDIRNTQRDHPDEKSVPNHPLDAYQVVKRWYYIYKLVSLQYDEEQYRVDRKPEVYEQDDYEKEQDDDRDDEDEDSNYDVDVPPVSVDCEDTNPSCSYWAENGDCTEYKEYMTEKCKMSCNLCRLPTARDDADNMLLDMFYKLRESTRNQLPKLVDFDGSAEGILRLQDTYQLQTDDIFHGNIKGFRSIRPLTIEDCFHVGVKAAEVEMWEYALEWLKKADRQINDPFLQFHITWTLTDVYIGTGNYLKANETLSSLNSRNTLDISSCSCFDITHETQRFTENNVCEVYPDSGVKSCAYYCKPCKDVTDNEFYNYKLVNTISNLKAKMRKFKNGTREKSEDDEDDEHDEYEYGTYEKLCRGEGIKRYSKSVCRYRAAGIDWNCYKEEILSMNPRISMVYDVITDTDAEILKSMAKNKMSRGLVGAEGEYSNVRISNVGWLDDIDDEYIRKLSERIELITGLEVTLSTVYDEEQNRTSSDLLQAVNYGIGGHYEPHVDYFKGARDLKGSDVGEITRISGDRIATFLIYLTNVTAGGATVYPRVKVHVPPIKNAAAFWFNARLSGRYDKLTLHAGCPVLLGEKWVCNKWVREYGNEFKRRCGLTKEAKYS